MKTIVERLLGDVGHLILVVVRGEENDEDLWVNYNEKHFKDQLTLFYDKSL